MQTPYELTGEWTSREDGEAFLDAASAQYGFPVETLATSVEGRPVRAALLGAHPDEAEQTVLLVAAQHGNEPASREGAFALIRDLAELESRYTKVWRQDSPPPSGTHYAWLGEPHASVSVRLDGDGNETARNLVEGGSFENGSLDGWATASTDNLEVVDRGDLFPWLDSGRYVARFNGLSSATGSGYVYKVYYNVTPGEWYAVRTSIKGPEGEAARLQIQFRAGGTTLANLGDRDNNPPAGGRDYIVSAQVPAGADSLWVLVWPPVVPPSQEFTYFDGVQIASADTESAALAQISTYFDGDTESDRAHDLWYDTAGVPHEWVNGQGWVEITNQPELNYLGKTSWVIIPTLNIDRIGTTRRNANNVDLNRDWEDKSQPETWAVLDVLDNWQPTLVIDAHEMFHGFDAWVGLSTPSTNAPVHPEISRVSGLAHEHAIQAIIDSGSTYADYGESGAMTLRTYAGTQHASSILIETYAWNEEREGHLRVADQITVMHALLEHHQIAYNAYRYASDVSRNPETAVHMGGGVPFFTMWHNPQAYVQDKGIVDAYLQTNQSQVRVYDHLGTLL